VSAKFAVARTMKPARLYCTCSVPDYVFRLWLLGCWALRPVSLAGPRLRDDPRVAGERRLLMHSQWILQDRGCSVPLCVGKL